MTPISASRAVAKRTARSESRKAQVAREKRRQRGERRDLLAFGAAPPVPLLLLIAFPLDHDVIAVRRRLRPLAAARLGAFFLTDVLRSTIATALDVVRPRSEIRTGIIACPLRVDNDGLLTFLRYSVDVDELAELSTQRHDPRARR